jgi:hypothetical protein
VLDHVKIDNLPDSNVETEIDGSQFRLNVRNDPLITFDRDDDEVTRQSNNHSTPIPQNPITVPPKNTKVPVIGNVKFYF